jgi:carboxylesterase
MTPPAERDVEVIPGPFEFDGSGPAAALCLHGLTGTPYEVRVLGEAIAAAGIHAFGPALPGHCETPDALSRVPHSAWLDAALGHYQTLRARFERVAVVGLSMGGLLSLAIAQREPVAAVVVVGTPLELPWLVRCAVPWLKHVWPMSPKREGSDIREPGARARHPSYDAMPLHSVHELIRLQRRVLEDMAQVRAPLFVAHGAHDGTANPADAQRIYDAVSSSQRTRFEAPASGHIVTVDHDGPELARRTVEFLSGALETK